MLKTINKTEFANKLFMFRVDKKLSKKDVAERIGVNRNTYSDWENPDKDTLPNNLNKFYMLSQVIDLGMHFALSGRLESDKDARFVTRIDALYHRQSSEPEFNELIKKIQKLPLEKVKALNELIDYEATPSRRKHKIKRSKPPRLEDQH